MIHEHEISAATNVALLATLKASQFIEVEDPKPSGFEKTVVMLLTAQVINTNALVKALNPAPSPVADGNIEMPPAPEAIES